MSETGLQTFMRMANLYGPQQMSATPSEPVELPQRYLIGEEPQPQYDENVDVGVEQPMSTLEAFRQSVLNPPKREHMTYPKSTLAGLQAGLQIAATPTDYEKNRVYVNGDAYQQARVYTDPKTGEKKYITKYKQPGFMEQVMKAMPAAVSPAVDILNQPYEDAKADWEMRNKGLASAATAEANMALAQQRAANAAAIPERVRQGQERIDISRMTAEEKVRLSRLNTLTDKQKIDLLQQGRISLAELQAAAALEREEVRGEYGLDRQRMVGEQQIANIGERGRVEAGHITQRGNINERLAKIRGEEARKTKAAVGWVNPNAANAMGYPSQQKTALQLHASQVLNQHPDWQDYVELDDEGFPTIDPSLDFTTYNQIYRELYGIDRTQAIGAKAPAATTPTANKPAPKRPAPAKQPNSGKVRVQAPDGRTGTWDYSKGPLPQGFKVIQ